MADQKISQLTGATTPLTGAEVLPIVQNGTTKKVSVNDLTIGKPVQTGALLSGTASAVGQITSFASASNDGAENAVAVMRFSTTYGSAIFHNYNSALNRETVNIAVSDGSGTPANNTLTKYRATADGSHYFYGATTSTLQMSITNGNLVIGAAGKGIDFSADPSAAGMTSELLDDYEEGTWTPTDASGAGLTFTTSNTNYTKVGNTVFVTGVVTFPATADASAAQIGGLPFTAKASSNGFFPAVNNASLSIVGNVASGTATFYLAQPETTNNRTNANMSTYLIAFSGTYLAA